MLWYAGLASISSIYKPNFLITCTKSARFDLFLSSRWISKWLDLFLRCISKLGSALKEITNNIEDTKASV